MRVVAAAGSVPGKGRTLLLLRFFLSSLWVLPTMGDRAQDGWIIAIYYEKEYLIIYMDLLISTWSSLLIAVRVAVLFFVGAVAGGNARTVLQKTHYHAGLELAVFF